MMPDRIALRPRSLLAVGDLAIQFTRRNARWLAWPVAWAAAPVLVLAWFAVGAGTEGWAVLLALAAVGRVSSGLVTLACAELALHPQVRLRPLLWTYLQRLPRWAWLQVVEWPVRLVTLGVASIAFAFAHEVALLERGGVAQVLRRTSQLQTAHAQLRWTMPALALAIPLWWYASAVLGWEALLGILQMGGQRPTGVFESLQWVGVAGAAVGEMAWTVLRFLLYLDCRTRGDGWDLQVQCQALVQAHAGTARRAA